MSASFPQMAFWVIFPLAAFVVITGWSLTIFVAVKRLRSGQYQERKNLRRHYPRKNRSRHQRDWEVIETVTGDGTHYAPLS